jgi:hypothetical protein
MARRGVNYPNLEELSDVQRSAIITGAEALKVLADFRRRTFDEWMTVARGLKILRELADQRTARKAFKNLRKEHGYGSLPEPTCTRLVLMAKHETTIRGWRDGLTERQRESWNSPTSICQRCSAVRAEMAKAPPRKPRQASSRDFEVALDKVMDVMLAADDDAKSAMRERITKMLGLQDEVDEKQTGLVPSDLKTLRVAYAHALANAFGADTKAIGAETKLLSAELSAMVRDGIRGGRITPPAPRKQRKPRNTTFFIPLGPRS